VFVNHLLNWLGARREEEGYCHNCQDALHTTTPRHEAPPPIVKARREY
jgi:hypothetical protein